VKSIGLNITFLALERGFDVLTVYTCPGGGGCKELKRYSDHDLQKLAFDKKNLYFFDSNVQCPTIIVNSNEVRLKFTSDGPLPKNPDVPASVLYKGFSAVYWTFKQEQSEAIGCFLQNASLTESQGSIFAVDDAQMLTTGVLGQSWLKYHQIDMPQISKYGMTKYKEEYQKRCLTKRTGSGACDTFGRQQSRWWKISPKGRKGQGIALAIREVVLEDSLDTLTIYSRMNDTVSKVSTISGLSPFRNHDVLRCSKCATACATQTGASGTITEKASAEKKDVYCTWILDAATQPLGYKYLVISFSQFTLKSNFVTIETCMDKACISASDKFQVVSADTLAAAPYISRTGMARVLFSSQKVARSENFKLEWKGICKQPFQRFRKGTGTLDDGWGVAKGGYPPGFKCSYVISPEAAAGEQVQDVTAIFSYVDLVGNDQINVEACNETTCEFKTLIRTLRRQQRFNGTNFTASTGENDFFF
jgi:hypothetical protein